jgi:hypothetical protein
MQFRTEVTVAAQTPKITLQSPILTIGSCFAEVIGQRLLDHKLPAIVNPFGTIFNPLSIAKLLSNPALDDRLFVENQGVWFHYDFHSSHWDHSQIALKHKIQQQQARVGERLPETQFLIITLGTAFVYRHLATDQIVANCHKTPATHFRKELLKVDDIVASLHSLIHSLTHSQIILTLSPVRHTRDTLPLNAVSKSLLRVACHELSETLPNVSYFPAYEILLDDLRDYRFYKSDLIHPNEMAEDYIFQKFQEAYFDPSLQEWVKEWQKVRQALAHKPLHGYSQSHRKFLEGLKEKLQVLSQKVDLSAEIATVEAQLQN